MVDNRSVAPEESALLDVTMRLAREIEQQLAQLRRVRDRAPSEVDAGISHAEHIARRMQRQTERLRLLCGAEPGSVGRRELSSIADVLGAAVAETADPIRVVVAPAPNATVEPWAAAELRLVLAEVIDGALAEPGPGVTLGGRLGPAGLTVDVTIDGPRREWSRTASGVAEAMARRSTSGIQVHRSGVDGPYAIVLCPAASLTVPVQRRSEPARAPAMQKIGFAAAPVASSPLGTDMFGVRSNGSGGGAELFGSRVAPSGPLVPAGPSYGNGARSGTPGLFGPAGSAPLAGPPRRLMPPPVGPFGVDPLFGPLPVRGRLDEGVGTPIYEAVVSAWFQEDDGRSTNGHATGWESPGDAEWRAAADRAARADGDNAATTASGLPRRRPGRQMVTPPLRRGAAVAATTERDTRVARPDERAPDRVRSRLDDYQRGLEQGRHRAIEAEPPDVRPTRWAGSA